LRRLIAGALLLLFVFAFLPSVVSVGAQGTSRVVVDSVYTLNRYGYATVGEVVSITNNGTSAIQAPSITFGFGDLSSSIVAANVTSGYSLSPTSGGGPFTVTGESVQAGGNATFTLQLLLNGVVSTAKNGSLQALVLTSPSINIRVDRMINVVKLPVSTVFAFPPAGMTASLTGSNDTYFQTSTNTTPSASTSLRAIATSTAEDFNPLHVYAAQRTISAAANGTPLVTDEVQFENLGTNPLSQIYISMLAPLTTKVTIITSTATEPILLHPFQISVTSGAIDLTTFVVGYPSDGVQTDTNFTLTYQYPLGSNYYSVSGGKVTVNIPDTPPVSAFVDSYNITLSLPRGAESSQGGQAGLMGVTPWQADRTTLAYSLSAGWFLEGGIPVASVFFILLLIGLFAARTTTSEAGIEEEEEMESSSEQASGMINAFDEKTGLINGLWQEIESKDPSELDKAYFDELRGRLDEFRSRAIQRLNEVRQRATSQRFSEVVNQIQSTEREVDRAAKDKLNLYQQYYLKQMRKEVFDRLHPQYTKRLERALNQLSDELHTVQREAKLV
jgi:hypothetical protein